MSQIELKLIDNNRYNNFKEKKQESKKNPE